MQTQKILRLYCISCLHLIGSASKIELFSEVVYYLARKLSYWELNGVTDICCLLFKSCALLHYRPVYSTAASARIDRPVTGTTCFNKVSYALC
jgi:hypothetical protein